MVDGGISLSQVLIKTVDDMVEWSGVSHPDLQYSGILPQDTATTS